MNAMMIAMYYVLDGISLKLNDYMKITFNSFAVIICIVIFGMLDGCIVADRCKNSEKGVGFDANSMKWVKMVEAGIIDPVKVTRSALQNAASIAALILTTECAITDIPAPEPPMAQPNPGMGMM